MNQAKFPPFCRHVASSLPWEIVNRIARIVRPHARHCGNVPSNWESLAGVFRGVPNGVKLNRNRAFSSTSARTQFILRPVRVGGRRTHVAFVGRFVHLARNEIFYVYST